ncbi:hypothetical protein [Streptomyces atratus]|uniref:hypothetical protein n=1 Tax=Streptomyces atratus TaxID=1893 RepID=UPI0011610BD0|nr:hypothetical protein [Streptomyces atratus]
MRSDRCPGLGTPVRQFLVQPFLDGPPPRVDGVAADGIGPDVRRQLRVDDQAVEEGVEVIGDCGEDGQPLFDARESLATDGDRIR